jgi:hypothetical protein
VRGATCTRLLAATLAVVGITPVAAQPAACDACVRGDAVIDRFSLQTVRPLAGTLAAFDAFTTLSDEWSTVGPAWEVAGDAVAPPVPLAVTDRGLEHASVLVPGSDWWLRATFISKTRWEAGDVFGIVIRDPGAILASCVLECATDCRLTMSLPGAVRSRASPRSIRSPSCDSCSGSPGARRRAASNARRSAFPRSSAWPRSRAFRR